MESLCRIECEAISHRAQRYATVGDYYEQRDTMQFRISKMNDWRLEILVLIHELVEYALVRKAGIKIEDIDAFDIAFEKERLEGKHKDSDEPGDDHRAPYRKQHAIATRVEKIVAKALGVSWAYYSLRVNSLS